MKQSKYINSFETESDYNVYMADDTKAFLPNVAWVRGTNVVHYVNDSQPGPPPGPTIKYVDGTLLVNDAPEFVFNNSEHVTSVVSGNTFYISDLSSVTQPITSLQSFVNSNKGSIYNITINFDTSSVTDMSYMFYSCLKVSYLDISGFNTSSVTDMSSMFRNCASLTALDVSGFNTSSVTDMSSMFYFCSKVSYLDISGFNTSSVTDMSSMFYFCSKVSYLDISGFNTSSVTDMSSMFYNCSNVSYLDISGFNTSSVTDMSSMFRDCTSLTSLDFSSFDTSNVTNMNYMFFNCNSLTALDVSGFNTSSVTDMSFMFRGCTSLTSLDFSSFDTSNVTNMNYMFFNCASLTSLDLSSFTLNQRSMSIDYMFNGCSSLQTLNLMGWESGYAFNFAQPFIGCNSLTDLYLSSSHLLNLLTNNLSSADNGHVPSVTTIHYDDGIDQIDYVWSNGAWVEGSAPPAPENFMFINGQTFRSLNGIMTNGQLANGDYILYTEQPDDPTWPAEVTLTVDYNSGNRFYSTSSAVGGAFRLYNNTDGYIEIVTNGTYGNITKIEFTCVANYLGGDLHCDSGSFTSDSTTNIVTWEGNTDRLQIYNAANPQLRFDAFKIYFEAYSE